jgi:hypothetical protein
MKFANARADGFAARPAGIITLMSDEPISQSGYSCTSCPASNSLRTLRCPVESTPNPATAAAEAASTASTNIGPSTRTVIVRSPLRKRPSFGPSRRVKDDGVSYKVVRLDGRSCASQIARRRNDDTVPTFRAT